MHLSHHLWHYLRQGRPYIKTGQIRLVINHGSIITEIPNFYIRPQQQKAAPTGSNISQIAASTKASPHPKTAKSNSGTLHLEVRIYQPSSKHHSPQPTAHSPQSTIHNPQSTRINHSVFTSIK
ncbi:hypothetical protein ACN42_g11048 [Penicillium freii]|uniref:Uncharacterized protein n=1 Tax=Penicillium freii TaxID=48697 RepID=A0A101M8Y8_PENFR|nr:hypothetical protein ACN42_g11048 [Penicillium freii]